jgi:phosphatidylserine/phosphatidylglycerophosphate/cardiolipin synthase-like enzyme
MPALKRFVLGTGVILLAVGAAAAKTLDTCFSPLGHCDQVLVSWINASEKTLDAAIYGLTDSAIAEAFVRAKARGVRVRLIEDRSQAGGRRNALPPIRSAGVLVRVQNGSGGGIQHNKFLIIDHHYVVTGSFNWTVNATEKNDENFVVLDDEAPKFEPEFERLWSGAKVMRRRKSRSHGRRNSA